VAIAVRPARRNQGSGTSVQADDSRSPQPSLRSWRANLALPIFLGILAFAAVLLLGFGSAEQDPKDPTGPGDYQGYLTCGGPGCHDTQVLGWNATRHASAWDDLQNSGMAQDYCEACHTTGAGDEARGGFNVTTNLPVSLQNVQCEVCHGPDPMSAPGGARTRIDLSPDICGACHQGEHHPYLGEWQNSTHSLSLLAASGEVATNTSCQGCHVAQVAIEETFGGGTLPRPIANPQPIVCAVCHDTHNNTNEFQLRKPRSELCATCHNPAGAKPGEFLEHPQGAMRDGLSEVPTAEVPSTRHMQTVLCADCHMYSRPYDSGQVPPRVTGHEFRPKPEACATCHDGVNATLVLTAAEAQAQIDAWQAGTRDLLRRAATNVSDAYRAIQDAPGLGFPLPDVHDATTLYDLANYSVTFVDADGSQGVHNPTYSTALLQYANAKAQEALDLLRTGRVEGRVLDTQGRPVADVEVRLGDAVLAVTGADGRFAFDRAPGTYNLEVRGATSTRNLASVAVAAGEVTDVGDVVLPDDGGLPIAWILAVVLGAVAAAFILMFLRRPQGTKEPDSGKGGDDGS